jgi:hypothetical protein
MNQRIPIGLIQSLAEFAGGIRKHYPEVWQFTDEQLEQFALMIANRCAKACLDEGAKWRGEQDITDFKLCAQVIKEQFGIEE